MVIYWDSWLLKKKNEVRIEITIFQKYFLKINILKNL